MCGLPKAERHAPLFRVSTGSSARAGRAVITYAERACFGAAHLRLRSLVEAHVACVSNAWGNDLRCHELARAVHLVV